MTPENKEAPGGLGIHSAGGHLSPESDFIPSVEGYEILGKIGQGGMGTVWRARQLATRREVALKLMSSAQIGSDRDIRRFEREVELAAGLEHPNIARVYDSGVRRGVYFYAMEFIDGKPLDLYVEDHHLSRKEILQLMLKVCLAVQHAHQNAIIHRDIKPSNILVTGDGQPHVLDFGLAKQTGGGDPAISMSLDGELVGTPIYMSPEQAAGTVKNLNTSTDVYSLGVLLYELMLGVFPHAIAGGHWEILRRARDEEPIRPRAISSAVDRDLDALMLKAVAHNPQHRYGTAGELAADIERYLAGNPLVAKPPTATYLLAKTVLKHRGAIALASLVLTLLMMVATYAFVRVRHEKTQAVMARDLAIGESVRARRASARSDFRFALQDRRLRDALSSAEAAYRLGGGQWEDGLLLNEVYEASRRHWSLSFKLPPMDSASKACFARHDSVDYFVAASNADLRAYALDGYGKIFTNRLPSTNLSALKFDEASSTIVAGDPFSVSVYELPDLKLRANQAYVQPVRHFAAGGGRILLVHDSGDIRVAELPMLNDLTVTSWSTLAGDRATSFPRIAALSPGGTRVLLHAGPWKQDSLIWDWPNGIQATSWVDLWIGAAAFLDEHRVLTWFTPSGHGGEDDGLILSNTSGQQEMESDKVSSADTKGRIELETWSDAGTPRAGLWGVIGCILHDLSGTEPDVADRYENLWPFPDESPRFLAGSMQHGWLALGVSSNTLIFKRRPEALGAQSIGDFCATTCDEGMLTICACGSTPRMLMTPFDPAKPRQMLALQWLEGDRWYPWALWSSPDGQDIAVAAQESEELNRLGDSFGRTVVLTYRNPGWRQAMGKLDIEHQVPLDVFPPESPWIARRLAVSPDRSALLYWRADIGKAFRYAISDARRLEPLNLGKTVAISPSGRFVAGAGEAQDAFAVYEVASGRSVPVVSNVVGMDGALFISDETLAVHAGGVTRVFDLATGSLLSKIEGGVVPMAIHPSLNVYAGFVPDASGSGGNVVLADVANGNPVSLLSAAGQAGHFSSFSPSGKSLVVVEDRWRASMFQSMDPETVRDLLATPRIDQSVVADPSAPLPPMAGPKPGLMQGVIRADDPVELRRHLGERVAVEGRLTRVVSTRFGDAVNLEFEGLDQYKVMGWIPPQAVGAIAGAFEMPLVAALDQKQVRITGNLLRYGGKNAAWQDRFQITVLEPSQIVLLGDMDPPGKSRMVEAEGLEPTTH